MHEPASRRLDQWLWFARIIKSRSQAARLCMAGAVEVNGAPARRARHNVGPGDTIVLHKGGFARRLTVRAPGSRRGPPAEARALYEEAAAPARLKERAGAWVPLLADNGPPE